MVACCLGFDEFLSWLLVIHTVKIDEVRQIIDVESFGKSADEIEETVSFGEMQLKQEDRSYEFTDELSLVDSFPLGNDDLFDFENDNEEWRNLLYQDLFDHTSLEKGILIRGSTYFVSNVVPDKNLKKKTSPEALLILKESNFLPLSSDRELLFHLELSVTETLLSFSSENEDKVFNPGILISKGVHPLTLELSHRNNNAFKIINVYSNILNERFPMTVKTTVLIFSPPTLGLRSFT
ncbi:hypothetical protein Tco_0920282 [Tanacetum coccineum]